MTGHQPPGSASLTDAEQAAWRAAGTPEWAMTYGPWFREHGITPDQAAPYWTRPDGTRLLEPDYIREYLARGVPAATVHRLQHAGVLRGHDLLNLVDRGCPVAFAERWLADHLTEDNATGVGSTFARRWTNIIDTVGCPPAWLVAFWDRFDASDRLLRGRGYDLLRDWFSHHPHLAPPRAAHYATAGVTVAEYAASPQQFDAADADALDALAVLRDPR